MVATIVIIFLTLPNIYFNQKIDGGWRFGPLAPSPIYTTVSTPHHWQI